MHRIENYCSIFWQYKLLQRIANQWVTMDPTVRYQQNEIHTPTCRKYRQNVGGHLVRRRSLMMATGGHTVNLLLWGQRWGHKGHTVNPLLWGQRWGHKGYTVNLLLWGQRWGHKGHKFNIYEVKHKVMGFNILLPDHNRGNWYHTVNILYEVNSKVIDVTNWTSIRSKFNLFWKVAVKKIL